MGQLMKAEAHWRVTVSCEACNHSYTYDQIFSRFVPVTIVMETQQKYSNWGHERQQDNSKLPVMRCPKCRYIQSWNQSAAINDFVGSIYLLSILGGLAVGLLAILRYTGSVNGMVDFLLADLMRSLLVFLVTVSIVLIPTKYIDDKKLKHRNPNKRWLERNGPAIPSSKKPKIERVEKAFP
jgi:hypothetical protein